MKLFKNLLSKIWRVIEVLYTPTKKCKCATDHDNLYCENEVKKVSKKWSE